MSDATSFMSAVSTAPSTPLVPANAGLAGAKKAGQDFEAFFMSQAFENMYSGLDSDPMFGGGNGEQVYRSLMLQEYSKVAAQSGSTGIGAAVTRQILQMQEIASKGN